MKARLGLVIAGVSASLWFLPAVLSVVAIGAALGLIELDRRFEPGGIGVAGLIFHGGPEGARAVLSAMVSSMMTVTGVTFSITVVALTLASQQYTPRVLRHFAADRGNQVVLGTFIGTFIYCLLVLRTVRADAAGLFVPHIAITGGIFLAVASLALLIYFIHHVAVMIQPSSIIQRVANSTAGTIDQLFPDRLGEAASGFDAAAEGFPDDLGAGTPIPDRRSGYLQAVDVEGLLKRAREDDLVIRMDCAVGEYVSSGAALATVWSRGREPRELQACVNSCFAFGRDRTDQHDPEYGIIQLSDIGVKALSPGINDPTTALTCLDFLGDLLVRVGTRRLPSAFRKDEEGRLRVVTRGTSFARMTDLAFSQIRHYGEKDAEVTLHLLRTLTHLGAVVGHVPEYRRVLQEHVEETRAGAERGIVSMAKRRQIERSLQQALRALDGGPRPEGYPACGACPRRWRRRGGSCL